MKRNQNILIGIFAIVCIIELVSRWLENHTLEYMAKPLIMPLLALYFLLYSQKKSFRLIIILACFFSFVGDMFLMLSHTNEMLFYAGVGGFFLAQVCYMIAFLRYSENTGKGFLVKQPLWIVLFLGYLAAVLILLFPGMDGFMRPVIVIYGLSLVGMSVTALNRRGKVSPAVFNRVFVGSIFFVISDSMIAINKFYHEIPKASFLIILTYILAQVLIMSGLVVEKEYSNQ